MKILLFAALGFVLASGAAVGQVVTLFVPSVEGTVDRYSDDSVILEDGDVAEVLDVMHPTVTNVSVLIGEDELIRRLLVSKANAGTNPDLERVPIIVEGPAVIRVKSRQSLDYATIRVTRQGTDGIIPVPQSPSNTDYEVFLEASSDMETWVRVIPGDYSSNGAAKFFRVRMAAK